METSNNPVAQAYSAGWQVDDDGEWWKPEVGQHITVGYLDDHADLTFEARVEITRVDDDSFDVLGDGHPLWTIYLSELMDGIVTVMP